MFFGIAGLVVPAYQAVQALSDRISATKSFPKKLRSLNAQITLQKKLFDNECILLFGPALDEALIRSMLSDQSHPNWRDRELAQEMGDFFGQSLLPFEIIRETVLQLDKEVEKVTVEDGGKLGTLKHAKGLYKKLQRPSELPNLDALLAILRAQILDLLNLRKQREAAQKRRYRGSDRELRNTPAASESQPDVDLLQQVLEVQKASKKVYTAIASIASCSCHRTYFQLQQHESEKPHSPESNHFKLVLTTGAINEEACTCIAIRKEADTVTPPPPYTPTSPTSKPVKKKLQFASSPTALTDLCSSLRRASSTPSYLGALPSQDAHRHIYTESQKPSITRISLPRVFEQAPLSRVRSILPPTRRYRLAWILSASLLRFGFASSWFRQNWRCADIYFLSDRSPPNNFDLPHLSVHFDGSKSSSTESSAGTCLAKNEQLYSLAIALIEIGYGATLRTLCAEGDGDEREWNHAREYAGAKELAESIGQVMSRRYAMVVRRCFYCSFAIDEGDLTPARLQRAFYEKVECELRRCLLEFSA